MGLERGRVDGFSINLDELIHFGGPEVKHH